ncbi:MULTISPECIES: GNAT family N-acetyltransferase [Gordonibacter]|uniref:GNAT family N-acetyltransferase n=2 Tax=Gordonibacter TaxID=644652 RepID=A0ABT7DI74_9ACTN|nr:GNAT family N-acetyltransferase [Gordonibacter sp. KGMB12511]MDJ1649204.1 GNAT family N-acetyltransferase [Gordonibacter sp. KGMB12511]HIW76160.1 GNAT family N-acetyltransferase [Candidatus Gordonibacter avicola]
MKIAVSACMLGEPCRYDGASKPVEVVGALKATHDLVPVCPEVAGGLPIPHPPCEIVTAERALRVIDAQGADQTDAFLAGARQVVELVKNEGCNLAILKAKSPSCGCGRIYDGTFSNTLVPGYGVAARLLRGEGIRAISEELLSACLQAAEAHGHGHKPPVLASSAQECPALVTERLVLRPLAESDAPDVFAYCCDSDVGADAGWPAHRSEADALDFIRTAGAAPHVFGVFERLNTDETGNVSCEQPAVLSANELPPTGPCIGSVGLIPDPQRRNPDCLMLGYALAKPAWGRGLMTEAAREVIRYGFEELGLPLITCTHYTFNNRSRRVIEKCGFMREGTLHGGEATPDGLMQDLALYSLAASAWQEAAGDNCFAPGA